MTKEKNNGKKSSGKKMTDAQNKAAKDRADKKKADKNKTQEVKAQNMPATTKRDLVQVYALVNMHCKDGCNLVMGKMCDITKKEKARLEADKREKFFRDVK